MVNDIKHHSDLSDERDESDDDLDFAFEENPFSDFKILKAMREKVNWENEKERQQFFRRLHRSVKNKKNLIFYNFRSIFRQEEIDWLLIEDVKRSKDFDYENKGLLIKLVARSYYKDVPEVDEDGEPILRRTTAVHWAARLSILYTAIVDDLFKIYNRFDVNYIDEFGFTHFHAACQFGYDGVVAQFLVHGQHPDGLHQEDTSSVDPPLHLALCHNREEAVRLLLISGADPTLTNKDGWTPLHFIISYNGYDRNDFEKSFFKICDEKQKPIDVNAVDQLGQTPLHVALMRHYPNRVKMLLRRGADPNFASKDGSTPLHILCKYRYDHDWTELFFKINDELHQSVQVNMLDALGRTPLQWAVSNLLIKTIVTLLERGADLSSFVFPTEDYFAVRFTNPTYPYVSSCHLEFALQVLAVVEHLEKRGYELKRADALTILGTFDSYQFFDKFANLDERCFEDEWFTSEAKNLMVNSTVSLYDLIQMQPEEVEKQLTYDNYMEANWQSLYEKREVYVSHLCEMITRGFCRRWAREFLLELTCHKLPISLCEKFIDPLINKDLFLICSNASNKN